MGMATQPLEGQKEFIVVLALLHRQQGAQAGQGFPLFAVAVAADLCVQGGEGLCHIRYLSIDAQT